jgi:hypothetical protein
MPTLNFLFWNVQKKDLTPQIVNLAHSKQVDVLILAENPVSDAALVLALNKSGSTFSENHPRANCKRLTVVTKFPYNFITPVWEDGRMTTRRITLPGIPPFLLTALHLPDKMSNSTASQSVNASQVATQLLETEVQRSIDRHLVIGDFNMNPFEEGMMKADGLHGTMSSRVAQTRTRTVQRKTYPYFYNPTWSLLGDLTKEAAGTHYYRRAEHICYEWNVFDQVLLRPSLIPNFVKESLMILEEDGVTSLLKANGRPNKATYSDHLPLYFTLRF